MDYIILNNDGSLNKSSLTRYIQQGNHGVDKIFVGWANGQLTDIAQAVFTLPNQTTNTELGDFRLNYAYDGEHTMNGWIFTLTNAQTLYNGLLMTSVRIIRSGIVQVAYPFALVINETGVRPEDDSGLTIEQIDSYLLNLQNLVTIAVQTNTDSELSNTSENPVQNKVVKQAIDDAIAGVYKVQGSANVSTLNGLTKGESLNGYVYNMLDAGTLTNSTDTTAVQIGDNVVFVWNEGTWYWDRLAGVVDTSNLVTLDTDQTITGIKTFEGDLKFKGVGVSTVGQITTTSYSTKIGFGGVNYVSVDNNAFYTNVVSYSLGSSSKRWGKSYFNGDMELGDNTMSDSPKLGFISTDANNQGNWYLYVDSSQQFFNICQLNGANYVGIKLSRDSILPTNTNYVTLGSSSFRFKELYLRAADSNNTYGIDFGNNAKIYEDTSNRMVIRVSNTDKIKIGSSETLSANKLSPDQNGIDLGRDGLKWGDIYTQGALKDGTNSVKVSEIATKADTTNSIDLGTFDSNGQIKILVQTLEETMAANSWKRDVLHGVYMLTYSYAQAVMYLDGDQIKTASSAGIPVRTMIPVTYNNGVNAEPGSLKVTYDTNTDEFIFEVNSGYHTPTVGTHLYLIETGLV